MDADNQSATITELVAWPQLPGVKSKGHSYRRETLASGLLHALIDSRGVSCRGVFSLSKRCRVRNNTAVRQVSLGDTKAGGGVRLFTHPIPGNGLVVDPAKRATSWSTSDTGLCAYDRDPRK